MDYRLKLFLIRELHNLFVSLTLNKKFCNALGTLESLLVVEITDAHTVRAARVFRRSILNISGELFPIEIVPIPLKGLKVISRMYWLGANGAIIYCKR